MSQHAVRLAVSGALVIALTSSAAWAAGGSPDTSGALKAPVALAGAHKAVSTFINSGISASLSTGFNNVDNATTINCGNAAGCTISVAAMVQLFPNGASWAICPVVDGSIYMNPPCPFQGSLPDTGSYVTGNGLSNIQVAQGSHTVQLQVYVTQAASLGSWQVNYTLYKP